MPAFLDAIDGGEARVFGGEGLSYQKRRGMYELEGWNTLEIICQGTSSTHILNGKLVNRCENIRTAGPGAAPRPKTSAMFSIIWPSSW